MSKKNRKRKLEGEEQTIVDWEQENFFPEEIRNEMESMWEIPQIFHFLHLAKNALNIPHLSMYEMERMLLIPRASKQLANIMTSLLSSPMTKAKLRKIPPMPYEFWTNILAYKMKSWFKIFEAKHRDAVKVLEIIGVEPEFWSVFPDAPLLNGKDFEELTFKQKVWLLKTICDTVMHTRKTVQEAVGKQPWEDQIETILGTDRYGARYVYFPQFLKSDLRIYRHSLDNNILSTVKPIKPKLKADPGKKTLHASLIKKRAKYRRKKSRWSTGLTPKSSKKKVNKSDEKHVNDCKCSSDSATGSLINEDTNLSSTSTCSNNNNNNNNSSSNNNNVNLDTVDIKRSRSPSKCSEMSTESDKTRCKSVKSSGYDTNSSMGTISKNRSSQKMFKGFSDNSSNNKCNIKIINGILCNLKAGTSEENNSTEDTSQITLELNPVRQQYLDTMDLHIARGDSADRTIDNLSSISKTDDEKLNEIISAESSKLNDKDNVHTVIETHQISITSKSDDEKLNETRTSHRQEDSASSSGRNGKESIVRQNGGLGKEQKPDKTPLKLDDTSKSTNEVDSFDDTDLSLSELRSMLQKEAMDDDFSLDEETEVKYDLRKSKYKKTEGWKQEKENFNEMLLELSASKFQLVADSISSFKELIASFSLKNLISTFSQKRNGSHADSDGEIEPMPPCEVKLIQRMTELLSSLEGMEPALRDSMKKARGKLQKEWTNFKAGSAEDQDSSGEGLGSNWWVLGSQGCPLPTSGDTTLQTLSQPTVSPTGSQTVSNKHEEEQNNHAEHDKTVDQECKESQDENAESEAQGGQPERDEGNSQDNTQRAEKETKEDSSEEEQHTRRVLRARGISSYTEQFYSDDEIEENELEEWADVEAVYAAPSAQVDTSAAHLTPKIRHADDRTNEEDSDQDWILPSSRKRKNKRPSANRRLKAFQHKLQNIKLGALQDTADSRLISPSNICSENKKLNVAETLISKSNEPASPEATNSSTTIENNETVVENDLKERVPSTETSCKVENVTSVHSELDIKDEGPIYDYTSQIDNSYITNPNSNYLMLKTDPTNYYLMQPNPVIPQNALVQPSPVVSNIVPPIPHGYYVQGGQNYIIQSPQAGFLPPQHFQPQGPQMMAPQQFVNHSGYLPCMVAAQPQPGYVATEQQMISQNPSLPIYTNPAALPRPPQNRYPVPRQNYPHPNGAVIRSSMPIRGNTPRANNARISKNLQQQRNTPVRMPKPRKLNTPAENINQKTTSLIVLSDSDDEIEMIITEKTGPETESEKAKTTPKRNNVQVKQKPAVTSDVAITSTKGAIPPQILQRMNQGGISITPVKPPPPIQNTNTQLVVVVNETGSHYALSLPNGSKLILTPEQVAQIRASNGGKLIL